MVQYKLMKMHLNLTQLIRMKITQRIKVIIQRTTQQTHIHIRMLRKNRKQQQVKIARHPLTSLLCSVVWALTKETWGQTTMETWSPYMDQAIKVQDPCWKRTQSLGTEAQRNPIADQNSPYRPYRTAQQLATKPPCTTRGDQTCAPRTWTNVEMESWHMDLAIKGQEPYWWLTQLSKIHVQGFPVSRLVLKSESVFWLSFMLLFCVFKTHDVMHVMLLAVS